MRPWTIDADDIHIATDFDAELLHKTPLIEDYLDNDRDDKFIVVGTKGFGKTLVLKAKRIAFQEAGHLCLPQDTLLDKPIGDKVFRREMLALYTESLDPWTKLWRIAIAVAVLKQAGSIEGLAVSKRLHGLIEDANLRSVLDHFVNLLDFPRKELFRCANDCDNQLVPRLRSINRPVAVFIDSLDEYFNKHIHAPSWRASDAGEVSPNIWYLSQMALVEVAYQLRRITKHLKVYAAVRKEAFSRLADVTAMVQQYRGSAIDIAYPTSSLREIFSNNICREKPQNLSSRSKLSSDPIEAFVGRTEVTHAYTGQREAVFDYIHRHTLGRPRDLMTVGQKLGAISPEERSREAQLKLVVHDSATEIAQEYLNEIAPYLGDIDLREELVHLTCNVLPWSLIESPGGAPEDEAGNKKVAPSRAALLALYKLGLVGHVALDPTSGKQLQRFLLPGEGGFDQDGSLPRSSYYIVHPILTGFIASLNPDYLENGDHTNLVGNGIDWKEPSSGRAEYDEQQLCILKADIKGFGAIMSDDHIDREVRHALQEATRRHASECLCVEIRDGDSVLIVHGDPNALLRAATRIREDLFLAPSHPELRIALDYGPVRMRSIQKLTVAGGAGLLRVARLEPRVRASEIWSTDDFKRELEKTPTLYEAKEIPGGVNLKKLGSEEDDSFISAFRLGPKSV
jgi:hypothetical protein